MTNLRSVAEIVRQAHAEDWPGASSEACRHALDEVPPQLVRPYASRVSGGLPERDLHGRCVRCGKFECTCGKTNTALAEPVTDDVTPRHHPTNNHL